MIFTFSVILVSALIALTIFDIRMFRLPDFLTLPLILIGLLQAIVLGNGVWHDEFSTLLAGSWQDSLMGAAIAYCSFVLIEKAYRYFRGKDGLGRGDAKLLAAGGAWCGWMALPFIVLIASGAGLAALLLPSFRAKADNGHIPFGPFLAFAIAIVWTAGVQTRYFA